ncbi:unnamed protein product, partial [Ectocarpus sp. 13 AM-2016]
TPSARASRRSISPETAWSLSRLSSTFWSTPGLLISNPRRCTHFWRSCKRIQTRPFLCRR